MAALTEDILIEQGATFSTTFFLTGPNPDYVPGGIEPERIPADLTGFSARAQLRTATNAPDITQTFTCTIDTILGSVTMALTALQTEAIPTPTLTKPSQRAKFYYTLEIYQNDGYVDRVADGVALVSPEATR